MALLSNTGPSGVSSTGTYTTRDLFSGKHIRNIWLVKDIVSTKEGHLSNWVHLEKLRSFVWHTHFKILHQFNFNSTVLRSNKCLKSILVGAPRMQDLKLTKHIHYIKPFSIACSYIMHSRFLMLIITACPHN